MRSSWGRSVSSKRRISGCESDGEVLFEDVKEAQKNPKRDINLKMSFLWRRELETIKRECIKFKYSNLSKAALRAKLIEKVDEDKLDLMISRELFNRDYTTLTNG